MHPDQTQLPDASPDGALVTTDDVSERDVATSDGVVSRLRHDRSARRWEIDGLYD